MRSRSSSRRRRSTPTTPNSPRESMLGEVASKEPIQSEMASKSNVRQTVARCGRMVPFLAAVGYRPQAGPLLLRELARGADRRAVVGPRSPAARLRAGGGAQEEQTHRQEHGEQPVDGRV